MAEQQQPGVLQRLVEQRFFDVPVEKAGPLIKAAVEEAAGTRLDELADGMWQGRIDEKYGYTDVTVRALPVENGTEVEVSYERHSSAMAVAFWGTVMLCLAMFILPLFFMVAWAQRKGREQSRARMILMHKTWKEITAALGAPLRSSYRHAPRRVYAPAEPRRIQDDRRDAWEDEDRDARELEREARAEAEHAAAIDDAERALR